MQECRRADKKVDSSPEMGNKARLLLASIREERSRSSVQCTAERNNKVAAASVRGYVRPSLFSRSGQKSSEEKKAHFLQENSQSFPPLNFNITWNNLIMFFFRAELRSLTWVGGFYLFIWLFIFWKTGDKGSWLVLQHGNRNWFVSSRFWQRLFKNFFLFCFMSATIISQSHPAAKCAR